MTTMHYAGGALILMLILLVGWLSGRKIQSAEDFTGDSRKSGMGAVAGALIGTLVGGSSTIGTAQLAFNYGFSAWWFTLGGGIGLLLMELIYLKPIYESGMLTVPQIIKKEYGKKAATAVTLLTSVGSFLSIIAQLLSGVGLITSISQISAMVAMILTAGLMMVYVIFGGVMGAGRVGFVKTILLFLGVGMCGVLAVAQNGGLAPFYAALPHEQYFSLIGRGAAVDIGAGLSLLVGIITTQAYVQAVASAKTLQISRRATLISAAIVPLIGIAGIYVGMFMKIHHPDITSAQALPLFIMNYLPEFPAGMILGTLLIALVGTGAGLSLGVSSMLCRDFYVPCFAPEASSRHQLLVTRLMIAGLLCLSCLFANGNLGSLIISWSFLSMGLRGAVAFFPLTAALFFPGKTSRNAALASMILGPLMSVLSKFIFSDIDPLFPGMAISFIVLLLGTLRASGLKRDLP